MEGEMKSSERFLKRGKTCLNANGKKKNKKLKIKKQKTNNKKNKC